MTTTDKEKLMPTTKSNEVESVATESPVYERYHHRTTHSSVVAIAVGSAVVLFIIGIILGYLLGINRIDRMSNYGTYRLQSSSSPMMQF